MPKRSTGPKINLPQITTKRIFVRNKCNQAKAKFEEEKAKANADIDIGMLRILREKIDQYQISLIEYDDVIQQTIADEEELTEEVNDCEEIGDDIRTLILEISQKIDSLSPQNGVAIVGTTASNGSVGSQSTNRDIVRLPKLEITKYNGDPLRWQEFWDQFESAVHKKDFSKVEKFQFLKMYLVGDAFNSIDGLEMTNAKYQVAIDTITERFGKMDVAISAHFEKILKLPTPSKRSTELRSFYDEMERHIRCLEALGLKEEEFAKTFTPVILMKLPSDVKLELNRRKGDVAWDLKNLRKLLKNEIVARESSSTDRDQSVEKKEKSASVNKSHQSMKSAGMLVANSKNNPKYNPVKKCSYCAEDGHYSDECKKYPDIKTRKEILGTNRCFLCLRNGHPIKNCVSKVVCVYCDGKIFPKHHRSLCPKQFGDDKKKNNENSHGSTSTATTMISEAKNTNALLTKSQKGILPTAITMVENPNNRKEKSVTGRVVMDTASQRSYATQEIVDRLKIKPIGYENLQLSTFGSNETEEIRCAIVVLQIKPLHGAPIEITVNVIPMISTTIQKEPIDDQKYEFLKRIVLAEPICKKSENVKLDILIGSDYYNDLVKEKRIELDKGLYLTDTVFGWILSGRIDSGKNKNFVNTPVLLASDRGSRLDPMESKIEKFWDLESVGVYDCGQINDDDIAIKEFNESIEFKDNRYSVSWPWKNKNPELPENFELAHGRMKSLQKRLNQNPELRNKYEEIIEDQLKSGIIEKVESNIEEGTLKHYLPHHGVLRNDSTSTKLRIVYDASAKVNKNSNSLNDCLHRGPVLLHDLCGLLIRFRTSPIGIISDIEKAFLQIGLNGKDRDVTRFLWIDSDGKLQIYRFCRVPFGVVSSPFLLEATVDHHLNANGSEIAKNIRDNIYVDNVCVGVDSIEEGKKFYSSAKGIFSDASMNLREWGSNSAEFMNFLNSDDRLDTENSKLLGLVWDKKKDVFKIQENKIDFDGILTKRKMLIIVAGLFDPLGLFSPVILRAKLAIQNLWKLNLDWNAPVPDVIRDEWNELQSDLDGIFTIPVRRFIGIENSLKNEGVITEIHCFCDSLALAYSACVYLRITQNGETTTNLLFAKTRLAPIKTLTIPRLELMAVLIGTRITDFVEKELKISIAKKFIWSDSKCVLNWIANTKLKSTFVENRLKEIRKCVNVTFRYVPTAENPADLPTRGMSCSDLKFSNLWWHGPTWLGQSNIEWPPNIDPLKESQYDEIENRKTAVLAITTTDAIDDFRDEIISRSSSFEKSIRILAYVLRAKNKFLKKDVEIGILSTSELIAAQTHLTKWVQEISFENERKLIESNQSNNLIRQLKLFINDDGLIRCNGRLKNSELSEGAKTPILLPKNKRYVELIIRNLHQKLLHAGARHVLSELRQNYWIIGARRYIKSIIHNCWICKKWEGGPFQPPPPPALPAERVLKSPPFTYIGIDFLGPLLIKNDIGKGTSKIWVCLFTCAVIRAVHLEVVPDMSTDTLIEAFRRFISRRGKPKVIISDNGKQFKLANTIFKKLWSEILLDTSVQNYVAREGIKWKFITDLAPWMGGFYERLVGIVKRNLRKTIDGHLLNYRQIETIVIEVEAVVNSRPSGFVGSSLDDGIVLTPALFLGIDRRAGFPTHDIDDDDPDFTPKPDSAEMLISKWKKYQKILNGFWKKFNNEYLVNLRDRFYDNKIKGAINESPYIDQPVLIKENLMPRGSWKIGVIRRIFTSPDGSVRSAIVQTTNGKEYNRPMKLLFPLECIDHSNDENQDTTEADSEIEKENSNVSSNARIPKRKAAMKAKEAITELFRRECRIP